MPIVTDAPRSRARPRVSVRGSVAVELEWALGTAARPDFLADHPRLAEAYRATSPGLVERITGFWGPQDALSCGGFMELLFVAHHGGALFSMEPGDLLDHLEESCAAVPAETENLALTSEAPEDRRAIISRLRQLRRSAATRRAYAGLLRDVWAAVGPLWDSLGRPAVDAAVTERAALLARGADWTEIVSGGCDFGPVLPQAVGLLGPGGEVAVVPAFFTHRGLFVDLPDLVVVGVRTDDGGSGARARTEDLARRLKTLADPTRLAMLDLLGARPRTVTEIASALGLAQPTVSNHVKVLREAGLLSEVREGRRRNLVVSERVVADVIDGLQRVLATPAVSP